ncbi:MAG: enoyl-CoA hydratase/isomerase family protein [Cypionkella sp.]|nr:enoyl-CoA hydratase/isomerase family protein [Cypionkella sp.]
MKPPRQTKFEPVSPAPSSVWARLDFAGDVAILAMDRPPTNALSTRFCTEISAMITHTLDQDACSGLVLRSDLAGFSSGADVADLVQPAVKNRAALAQLCRDIASARKPVVAAVHGACLSTGLDLALAAQGRVAGPQARFGFPDLRLGLLPAGGGVYRLTRLIGTKQALDLLLSSKAILSDEALELGMVDQLCAFGDEVTQAVAMVQELAKTGPLQRRDYLANLRADMAAVGETRTKMPSQVGPWVAQHRLLDCVEAALLLPEDMALTQEAAAFDTVQRGPIAQALSYAFVARERASAAQNAGPQHAQMARHAADTFRGVMAKIVEYFQSQGMARRDILGAIAAFGIGLPAESAVPACPSGADDVMPALLAAWANAGAQLLRTGAARHAHEIDFSVVSAGMCPNWQGGPLYLASKHSAQTLRHELARRAAQAGPAYAFLFTPDPLWDEMVASGLNLLQYQA